MVKNVYFEVTSDCHRNLTSLKPTQIINIIKRPLTSTADARLFEKEIIGIFQMIYPVFRYLLLCVILRTENLFIFILTLAL